MRNLDHEEPLRTYLLGEKDTENITNLMEIMNFLDRAGMSTPASMHEAAESNESAHRRQVTFLCSTLAGNEEARPTEAPDRNPGISLRVERHTRRLEENARPSMSNGKSSDIP